MCVRTPRMPADGATRVASVAVAAVRAVPAFLFRVHRLWRSPGRRKTARAEARGSEHGIGKRSSVVAVAVAAVVLCGGCLPGGLLITPISPDQRLVEKVLYRDSVFARDTIAVIDVEGLILNSPIPGLLREAPNPVSLLLEQLDAARKDHRVRAVIVRINSPGGGVTASQLMHDEITRFRNDTGKPVVAVMMDVAASGGYFVACACDEIVAQPTTVTGSIGVIMRLFDATGTMKMIGLTSQAVTSGPRKDSGSPFRAMRDEEREWFQGIVDQMYERFIEVVRAGRPNLTEARIRKLADGRVFTGTQALEEGLVDRVATLRQTVDALKTRTGTDNVRVVAFRRRYVHAPNYYARSPSPAPRVNLLNVDLGTPWLGRTPRFLYLWSVGL